MTRPLPVDSAGIAVARRLRTRFTKGEEVRYISHLDLMRTWERMLRRAGIKLAHTQGFNPRPRLVFAAPLSVGVTSDAEIVDVYIEDDFAPVAFRQRVETALPPGIAVTEVAEISLDQPPLMASVHSSDYTVELAATQDLRGAVADLLARDRVPYERSRKGAAKQADMRPAVLDLWILDAGRTAIGMRLRLDIEGQAVRPDEVIRVMDPEAQVLRIHRTALELKEGAAGSALGAPQAERSALTQHSGLRTQHSHAD